MSDIIEQYSDTVVSILGMTAVSVIAGICFEQYRTVIMQFLDRIVFG